MTYGASGGYLNNQFVKKQQNNLVTTTSRARSLSDNNEPIIVTALNIV